MQEISKSEYRVIHSWIQYRYGRASKCENKKCQRKSAMFNWCLKKGKKYERKRENFFELCKSCHSKYDFTEEMRKKFSQIRKGKKILKTRKRVFLFLEDGTFLQEFQAVKDCAKYLKVHPAYVSIYLSQKYKYRHILKGKYKVSFEKEFRK